MKIRTYQKKAMRTNDGKATKRMNRWINKYSNPSAISMYNIPSSYNLDVGGIIMAVMGLNGEVGEFTDRLKKHIFHTDFDKIDSVTDINVTYDLQEELGDVMWYMAMICEAFGWSLEAICQANIRKLEARYPDGFDTERAKH